MSRSRPVTEAELRVGERATWGRLPTADSARTADRPRMRLIRWKPLPKGSLRGFATVELPIGLTIYDVPVLRGPKGPWATLPGKPQLDKEGQHKRDVNGKPDYAPVLEWQNRDLASRFADTLISVLLERYPDALDGPA